METTLERESQGLTPTDVELVQGSWDKVQTISDEASTLFYACLFEAEPALRSLFPMTDLSEQKRKLMATLGFAVASLKNPDALLATVRDLGRRHVAYGVRPAHYEIVRSALMFALAKGLGDEWTSATQAAWEKTYHLIASAMLAAAREVS